MPDLTDPITLFKKHVSKKDQKSLTKEEWAQVDSIFASLDPKRKTDLAIISRGHKDFTLNNDRTVLAIKTGERPFLIDSITSWLADEKRIVERLLYTDADGQIALIYITLNGSTPAAQCRAMEKTLQSILHDVILATTDWQTMLERLQETHGMLKSLPRDKADKSCPMAEYLDFLTYIQKGNFTLLGYREYDLKQTKSSVTSKIRKGRGLGLLSDERGPVFISESKEGLTQDLQKLRFSGPILSVVKVNRKATVHRRVPLDAIFIKEFNKKGDVVGERLFIGLFTSVTYSRSVSDVPLLRHKVKQVTKKSGFIDNSHEYRALSHILEKYPRDELFQLDTQTLLSFSLDILKLQERPQVGLFTRVDPFRRYISCLTYVPRERYSTAYRMRMAEILEQGFDGVAEGFNTTLDDSPLGRILFTIRVRQKAKTNYDVEAIENQLIEAAETWAEKLDNALHKQGFGDDEATKIVTRYGTAFPAAYQDQYDAATAITDIDKIEEAIEGDGIAVNLYRPAGMRGLNMRLKVYHAGGPLILSDILPKLENMGLSVLSELPFEVQAEGNTKSVWIHDFSLKLPGGGKDSIAVPDIKDIFESCFLAIWRGQTDNDRLNALSISSGIEWRQVALLRTIVRYMNQMRLPYKAPYITQVLNAHPAIAGQLFTLFDTMLNPDVKRSKDKEKSIMDGLQTALNDVPILDHDRVIRVALNVICAVLRTNFYQSDKDGQPKPAIAIKLDSRSIEGLPNPKPFAEIFVCSPRVEAVHLRGDMIARGGLRWSDRAEDYRTEILGLMKAQMVKNAVIVPVGAKGGFILKQPPLDGGREAMQKEGVACYKIFITALLDITDNLDGADIIPPADTVRRDEDDPYLVVAADKGTATFSDIANEISLKKGFWMGDAFASGGSAGYDHKAMGITAKGAWESVKRHFREMNHNVQKEAFDVIGVGDMGGDVFGNGMLLSPQIRLCGAFNHLHIFCDPDPDPEKTLKERQRLFKAVKGWDAYNEKLLSKGGRIYKRSDKELTLTPEIMERFAIKKDKVTPFELMRAMLSARTDLLWFGGIGTYIKAAHESDADVGDKANDAIRIDARDVQALVIGEGANLGVTQAGRVAAAKNGVRLNADFIDNAGGVDCSDHEVNIKILLNLLTTGDKPKLSTKKRNTLLEGMTEEVAALVLRNNYQQTQAISLAELSAAEMLNTHAKTIRVLEAENGLDRALEELPDDAEIERRAQEGEGLTRPELGTLICWSKIRLYQEILDSDLPEDEALNRWLIQYFPKVMQDKYRQNILDHRLRREIIATQIASSIINRQGPSFMTMMREYTGRGEADIARATFLTRESFGLKALWNGIEALDNKVPARVQLLSACEIGRLSEQATSWFLNNPDGWATQPLSSMAGHYHKNISDIQSALSDLLPKSTLNDLKKRTKTLQSHGLPDDLAGQVASLRLLGPSCNLIRISAHHDCPLQDTAALYYTLGHVMPFDWLRNQIGKMKINSRWEEDALRGLKDRLYKTQAVLCITILKSSGCSTIRPEAQITHWLSDTGRKDMVEQMTRTIKRAANTDMAMLVTAEQRLSSLCG